MDQRTSGTDIPIGTTRASELNEPGGRAAADAVRETARDLGQRAAERAQAAVGQQKERATSELGAVAFALRDAATRLDGDNMMSGRLIRAAAERLDDFSRSLESRDLDGLLWQTRTWARRNPAAFIGAAVAAGFIASRFLKASEDRAVDMAWEGEYDEEYTPYEAAGIDTDVSSDRRDDYTTGTGISTPSGTRFDPGTGGGSFGGGMGGPGGGGTHGRS